MSVDITNAFSAANTGLLWRAIQTEDTGELQNMLTASDHRTVPVEHRRGELVRLLVERGADVNAVRADGFTPLLLAVFFGQLDVVQVLVEHGADLTARTRSQTSAEMWAKARGFTDIVEYLQERQDRSIQLVSSSLENDEWFKESLIAEPVVTEELSVAEPVIEEPVIAEPGIEEPLITEPVVTEGLSVAEPFIEEPVIAEPVIEEPLIAEPLESSEDDDEVTLVRPRSAKVLKDPPEIWDLVHENRSNFNPRAAFLSHVSSTRTRIALLIISVVMIGAVIGFATMRLQDRTPASAVQTAGSRKPNSVVQPQKKEQSAALSPEQTQPKPAEEKRTVDVTKATETQPSTIVSTQTTSDVPKVRSSRQSRRTIQSVSTSSSASETPNNIATEKVATKTETKTPPPVRTVTVTATVDAEGTPKKTPDGNSKLIQKPSAAQPRKSRVIQWP